MNADVITVAEYPDGVTITSVVRPLGKHGAEHVFVITRHGEPVGEAKTAAEAHEIALAADGLPT